MVSIVLVLLFGLWGSTAWWLYQTIRKRLESYRSFRSGREGEANITEKIRCILDNRWTIFRNIHLPGHKEDIDLVLVGPEGIWAIEIKSTKSTLRVEGKEWKILTKKGWSSTDNNPSDEVTRRALDLNNYLQRQGIKRYVERAIALAVAQPIQNFENSDIPVWLPATIETQVANLKTRSPFSENEVKRVTEWLNGLAEKQIAIEEAKYK